MPRTSAVRLLASVGVVLASAALVTSSPPVTAQSATAVPPYRNPALSVEARVADLVSRMTLEEKVGQLLMLDARGEDLSFVNTRQPGRCCTSSARRSAARWTSRRRTVSGSRS